MPQTPNFKKGVGQLATDRYDFQKHLDGTNFRHKAPTIDLSPAITIGVATFTDVQSIIAFLSGTVVVPTVPDATTSSKGIIQLGGDLNGTNTTALAPRVSGLQGTPISVLNLTGADNGKVLTWNGSSWFASTVPGSIVLTQDLGGTFGAPLVVGIQGRPVLSTAPTTGQVLGWDGAHWAPASAAGTPAATAVALGTVQLAGDFAGTGSVATAPRTSGINGATVPAAGALTTGNVLSVTGTSALSYAFIADVNVSNTAAISGTKISPNFGSQSIVTTGTAALGATTITGALVAGAGTAVNSLTGSLAITTRTISTNLVVDTTTTDHIIFVNASGGAVSVTLPVPTNGRKIIIKDISGNAAGAANQGINVLQHSTEKIEGLAASKLLSTNWGSWTFTSNGTDWFMI